MLSDGSEESPPGLRREGVAARGTDVSTWGSPERFLAIGGDAERRARSEEMVAEIADALAAAGEYEARIDAQTTQRIVDFNWAARQAGGKRDGDQAADRRDGVRGMAFRSERHRADGSLFPAAGSGAGAPG